MADSFDQKRSGHERKSFGSIDPAFDRGTFLKFTDIDDDKIKAS